MPGESGCAAQIIANTTWSGPGSWSRTFLAVGISLSAVRSRVRAYGGRVLAAEYAGVPEAALRMPWLVRARYAVSAHAASLGCVRCATLPCV